MILNYLPDIETPQKSVGLAVIFKYSKHERRLPNQYRSGLQRLPVEWLMFLTGASKIRARSLLRARVLICGIIGGSSYKDSNFVRRFHDACDSVNQSNHSIHLKFSYSLKVNVLTCLGVHYHNLDWLDCQFPFNALIGLGLIIPIVVLVFIRS